MAKLLIIYKGGDKIIGDVANPNIPTDGNNITIYIVIAIIVCILGVILFKKTNKKEIKKD